jgi:hypothetical protein
MPGYTPTATLPPFSSAVTESAVRASTTCYKPEFLIRNLTQLSGYLVSLVDHTNLFGAAADDPYSPSLKTLHSRLHSGHPALTPLIEIAKHEGRMRETLGIRIHEPVNERALEDFEDLYYAVLARMQDMVQTLNMRIASGFNSVIDPVFEGGPRISDFHVSLAEYWSMFNDPACVRALDDAVRQARVNRLYEEINADLEANVITRADADAFLADLYHAREGTRGVEWIVAWNPAMIGMYLMDKYQVLLRVEKQEDERQVKEMRKRARMKVKVRKAARGSRSPTKRMSLEKMIDDMEMILKDAGKGALLRRGPGQQARIVEQAGDGMQMNAQHVDKNSRIDVDHHSRNRRVSEQGQIQHNQSIHHHNQEWQLKSQRVSEYSNYLRGAASHNARSILDQSVCSESAFGSTMGSPFPETAEEDTDRMEF